jgi:hypothetical protein
VARSKKDYVKRKTGNAGWLDSPLAAKIFALLFAAMASWMGWEKSEPLREGSSVNVSVESNSDHSHPPVVGRDGIKAMIREALERQHDKNLAIFKKKEPWE